LAQTQFNKIDAIWGPHTVDAFATRSNRQLPRYMSLNPEPEAVATDAMLHSWVAENSWLFPPLNMVGRCLRKVREEKATATIVAPMWMTQPWWPVLIDMCIDTPMVLPSIAGIFEPAKDSPLPMQATGGWIAAAFRISGDTSKSRGWRPPPPTCWSAL
jgi:hypothetical protein